MKIRIFFAFFTQCSYEQWFGFNSACSLIILIFDQKSWFIKQKISRRHKIRAVYGLVFFMKATWLLSLLPSFLYLALNFLKDVIILGVFLLSLSGDELLFHSHCVSLPCKDFWTQESREKHFPCNLLTQHLQATVPGGSQNGQIQRLAAFPQCMH